MKEKCFKILTVSLLLAMAGMIAGCASSRKTITYPKKHRHRCNCPHFSATENMNNSTIEINYL